MFLSYSFNHLVRFPRHQRKLAAKAAVAAAEIKQQQASPTFVMLDEFIVGCSVVTAIVSQLVSCWLLAGFVAVNSCLD